MKRYVYEPCQPVWLYMFHMCIYPILVVFQAFYFPEFTGYPLEGSGHLKLQTLFYNPGDAAGQDWREHF